MKIMVNAKGDEGERDIKFTLRLPLSVLKCDGVWKRIAQDNGAVIPDSISGKKLYAILKAWTKENGHLTVVDIDTKDAKVKIVI
ncbi:MAG: hypothetical protein ACI4S4_07525 [Candidatus Ornithospirochaeta sp.]